MREEHCASNPYFRRGQVRALKPWELDPAQKRVGKRGRRAAGDQPYSYGSLNKALKVAAARAKVRWIDYRALHGFRRMVLNNALKITGNLSLAGRYIGDVDMGTLTRSYVRDRPEDFKEIAAKMRLPKLAEKA